MNNKRDSIVALFGATALTGIGFLLFRTFLRRRSKRHFQFVNDAFMLDHSGFVKKLKEVEPNSVVNLMLTPSEVPNSSLASKLLSQNNKARLLELSRHVDLLVVVEETESTQTAIEAYNELNELRFLNVLFVAERQTKGRGRGAREWKSRPGNVCFTLNYKFGARVLPQQLGMVFLASVVLELREQCPGLPNIQVHWPNDIYISGQKVCGILTTLCSGSDNYDLSAFNTGVGINIDPVEPYAGLSSFLPEINREGLRESLILGVVNRFFHFMGLSQQNCLDQAFEICEPIILLPKEPIKLRKVENGEQLEVKLTGIDRKSFHPVGRLLGESEDFLVYPVGQLLPDCEVSLIKI